MQNELFSGARHLSAPGQLQQGIVRLGSRGRSPGCLLAGAREGFKERRGADGGVCVEHLPLGAPLHGGRNLRRRSAEHQAGAGERTAALECRQAEQQMCMHMLMRCKPKLQAAAC